MLDSKNLSSDKKSMLYDLLTKYEFIFGGTIGTWKTKPVDIKLQPISKPYNSKPYPVTRAYGLVFCKEVERFRQLEVLKRVNRAEWGAPTFIQLKNNGTARLLSDFRKLNQIICRKKFPIPKIQYMLLNIEGFT